MPRFACWKGVADAATGIILLTKPEIIYYSSGAKLLNRMSGLRLPNPHPTAAGEISSQYAVAIMVRIVNLFSYARPCIDALDLPDYHCRPGPRSSKQRPTFDTGAGRHECSMIGSRARYSCVQTTSRN